MTDLTDLTDLTEKMTRNLYAYKTSHLNINIVELID